MPRSQPIEDWLRRRTRAWPIEYGLGFLGVFFAGALALFFTFWLIYVVFMFGFTWIVPHDHSTRLWLCLGVIVFLFISDALVDRRKIETLNIQFLGGAKDYQALYIPYVGGVSNINWFSTDTMHSYVRMWVGVLCTGPRLITESFHFLACGLRLASIDVPACAALLAAMVHRDGRVAIKDLVEELPPNSDPVKVLTQIQQIRGVLILRSEPIGMTLVTEFRNELRQLVPKKKRKKERLSDEGVEPDIEVE